MEARVKWIEGRTFLGETGSGHAVVMAGSSLGKEAVGPSPMELILLGLGGCATYDVMHILERGRQDIADCDVEISSERSQEDPKVFTKIHLHFKVAGARLNENKVARAVELSAEKYCSASAMLSKTADITHDYEVADTTA